MSNVRSLKPGYYEALRRLTLELAGVKLGADSEFLVETRLAAVARQEGYDDLPSMVGELFSEGKTRLAVNVVAALLERDMRFFDDKAGFDTLINDVLPLLCESFKGQPINILCYGCGSGQDVYSLAMTLADISQKHPSTRFNIVGLDYPSRGLSRAMEGRFTHFEVQRGLPARQLVKYFNRDGEDWLVNDALRERVSFQEFHLLSSLKDQGKFELVMFRNSLARYAASSQMRILRSLVPAIPVDGYLMLGSEETLGELNFGMDWLEGAGGFYKRRATRKHPDMIVAEIAEPLRTDFHE